MKKTKMRTKTVRWRRLSGQTKASMPGAVYMPREAIGKKFIVIPLDEVYRRTCDAVILKQK